MTDKKILIVGQDEYSGKNGVYGPLTVCECSACVKEKYSGLSFVAFVPKFGVEPGGEEREASDYFKVKAFERIMRLLYGGSLEKRPECWCEKNKKLKASQIAEKLLGDGVILVNVRTLEKEDNSEKIKKLIKDRNTLLVGKVAIKEIRKLELKATSVSEIIHPSARGRSKKIVKSSWDDYDFNGEKYTPSDKILEIFRIQNT